MNGEILEAMASQCDCFISSLKSKLLYDPRYLLSFPFEQYSLEECNYSLSYLFDQDLHFDSVEKIHEFLKKQCRL